MTNNGLSYAERLLKLSNYEVDYKEQKVARFMIKVAVFLFAKELKDYDLSFQSSEMSRRWEN